MMQNRGIQEKTDGVRARSAKTHDKRDQNKRRDNDKTQDPGKNRTLTQQNVTNNEDEQHKHTSTKKRKRRSTGGTFDRVAESKEEFRSLTTDDKLVKLFEMLQASQSDTRYMKDKIKKSEIRIDRLDKQQITTSDKVKVLEYKSIDLEARSRRNNLVFRGHNESYREDCEMVIADFLESYLDIDPSAIYENRAHRVGKYSRDSIRPIKVSFVYFKDV